MIAGAHAEPLERPAPLPLTRVLLVWTAVATVAVLQSLVQYAMLGALEREWRSALLQFPRWAAWAVVTPWVVSLTRRYALRGPSRGRALLVHVGAALLIIVGLEAAWTQLAIALEPARPLQPAEAAIAAWRTIISPLGRLLIGAITYTALVAAVTAIDANWRAQQAMVHATTLERDLAMARVHALKMQVHPHFLFNTLHTVSILIDEAPAAARDMVVRLGDLLRGTLARASVTEVPLEQELALLRRYLAIEAVRFHDRLVVEFDVDPALHDARVPDLILQPLAENAIRHGIAKREGAHRLTVRATSLAEQLVLEVLDDGLGPSSPETRQDGVGLATVRERLRTLYRLRDPLTLTTRAAGGACARITLPLRRADALSQV